MMLLMKQMRLAMRQMQKPLNSWSWPRNLNNVSRDLRYQNEKHTSLGSYACNECDESDKCFVLHDESLKDF
jgi:hypothetical protein